MPGIRANQNQLPMRRAGFTLIEILIVVVIVGTLLGVAIPRIGTSVTQDRVRRSAVVVQGMVEEAGLLAARRRAPVTLTLSNGWLEVRDRGTNAVLRRRSFGNASADLKATVAIAPTAGITIFPNGRSSSGLRISLTGGGTTEVVSRTATGILRRD